MYAIAAKRAVQIRRMNHRRDSLEDIFLNAMEGKSNTGAGAEGRFGLVPEETHGRI